MKALTSENILAYFPPAERLAYSLAFKTKKFEAQDGNLDQYKKILSNCIQYTKRHGIFQLIDQSYAKQAGFDLSHLKSQFDSINTFCIVNQLSQINDLSMLSELLKSANIRFILVKGLDIAYRYYDTPHKRISADLDILIQQNDLTETFNILTSNNFQLRKCHNNPSNQGRILDTIQHCSNFKEVISFERSISEIDVHPISALQFESLWEKSSNRTIKGNSYTSLAEDDNLEFILRHARKHNFHKAIWIYDIFLILKKYSEQELLDKHKVFVTRGVGREYQIAVLFSNLLCGLSLSEITQRQIFSDSALLNLANKICQQLSRTDESWGRVFFNIQTQIGFKPNVMGKISAILKKAFYPTLADFLYLNLPRSLSFLYFPVRPIRFILKQRKL